jgi:hypothetical protein
MGPRTLLIAAQPSLHVPDIEGLIPLACLNWHIGRDVIGEDTGFRARTACGFWFAQLANLRNQGGG